MRQYCNCEWNAKGAVMTLCAAHQRYETKRCAGFERDIDRLRSDLALLGPVTTPLNGQTCASCSQDCCDHWTYCPSCGAQERNSQTGERVRHTQKQRRGTARGL